MPDRVRPRLGDVACAAGWFLSQFAGRNRAGLDISPAILARAGIASPDAELRQGDFLEDQPAWHDRLDLVSCVWFAYCYVQTVDDVERLIANMAGWTSPTGVVSLPYALPDPLAVIHTISPFAV